MSVDGLVLLALFAYLFLADHKKFPPTHYLTILGFLASSPILVIMHFSGNITLSRANTNNWNIGTYGNGVRTVPCRLVVTGSDVKKCWMFQNGKRNLNIF